MSSRGCYEPCVLELPDGTVQIYFADETPYYERRLTYQNISVIESKDGGDTWGPARIVCYNEKYRDGMPVAMIHGDWIYVAIEANGQNVKFHPQIVCTRISDNWKTPVYGSSLNRFDPFKTSMESAFIYAAPLTSFTLTIISCSATSHLKVHWNRPRRTP